MANINTTVIIEVSGHGTYTLGKHGALADSIYTPLVTTVTGSLLERKGTITTGNGNEVLLFDSTVDNPSTFLKFFFIASTEVQLQFIGTSTNFLVKVAANDPFLMSSDEMLAAADTTNRTTEATEETIDEITVGNYSGGTSTYHMILVL